jgi:hypothetical protein
MSEDVQPYGAAGDPRLARVEELRALVAELEQSQRELADELGIESRSLRRWLSGDGVFPDMAILALRHLVAKKRGDLQPHQRTANDPVTPDEIAEANKRGGPQAVDELVHGRAGVREPGSKGSR